MVCSRVMEKKFKKRIKKRISFKKSHYICKNIMNKSSAMKCRILFCLKNLINFLKCYG
jgi:predicted protein tyrosine phosphatase